MYQSGEQVVYGIHGVCKVLATELRNIDRKQMEYYVLEPLEQPGARYYIPTGNPAALAKLRTPMTKQTLEELLANANNSQIGWISDENKRKMRYRELISGTDTDALFYMVCALHKQKKLLSAAGKKFHLCDENFLRDAQRLLDSEISLALDISRDQVGEYIQNAMNVEG